MGLITLTEFKLGLGESTAAGSNDARYNQAIENASVIIKNYTDRDFGTTQEDNIDRLYEFEGQEAILDIDDCSVVNSITLVNDTYEYLVPSTEWAAQPYNGPVYYWLRLTFRRRGLSPAMGFKNNLDRVDRWPLPTIVRVNADWGWPVVPADIKQATIWIAAAARDNPSAHISETIEGYSRTVSNQVISDPLPLRARQILDHYIRSQL